MNKPKIAIIAAGEMGGAVAKSYSEAGYSISTIIAGRGQESIARAKQANMQPKENLQDLLADCQIFMSILPPANAKKMAQEVSAAAQQLGKAFTYVECNAISPDHVVEIAALFKDTKVKFVDAGIVGGPPHTGGDDEYRPALYVSGGTCQQLNQTDGVAFNIHQLGVEVGRASGMKMSYASITKGVNSLLAAAFLTAENLGLLEILMQELKQSQNALYQRATTSIQRMPADAARWAPEMQEIAQTFNAVGVPDGFHLAAEQMMQILAASPFGSETRKTRNLSRDAAQTIRGLKTS